jgi:hypothetical protein
MMNIEKKRHAYGVDDICKTSSAGSWWWHNLARVGA